MSSAGMTPRTTSVLLLALALVVGLTVSTRATALGASAVTLSVSPNGSGSRCTSTSPCSLATAQGKVRALTPTMSADITVVLADGTYRLSSTWALTAASGDSGTNGFTVSYVAAAGAHPVLSGARQVTGWQSVSGTALMRAYLGTGVHTRQFYVNGVRQQRATLDAPLTGVVTQTATGYTTTSTAPLGWTNPSSIEFVYRIGGIEQRCPVSTIGASGGLTVITMASSCWQAATTATRPGGAASVAKLPTWAENAREFLTNPGEWYLDPTGWLYYWPSAGTTISTADAEVPVVERLVTLTGTPSQPLTNVRLSGLTFAYATWLAPSSGFSEIQANTYYSGGQLQMPLANVSLTGVQGVTLDHDTFTHLGGAGLAVSGGAHLVSATYDTFTDISGSGAELGDWLAPATTAAAQNRQLTFSDNTISQAGAEYHGAVGLLVGFVADSVVANNALSDLPYTGISYGFVAANSYLGGNQIVDNVVRNVVQVLWDGGGIYTIGDSPNTSINGNYVELVWHNMAGMYLDMLSSHLSVTGNVVQQSAWDWLFLQDSYAGCDCTATSNDIEGNYSDGSQVDGLTNGVYDASNTVSGNQTGLTQWPAGAQAIIAAAGPQ